MRSSRATSRRPQTSSRVALDARTMSCRTEGGVGSAVLGSARASVGGTDRAGGHTNHEISRQRDDHGHKRTDKQEARQRDRSFDAEGYGETCDARERVAYQ